MRLANNTAPQPQSSGAGVPGLEPRLTEPESVGLPITPYPIGAFAPINDVTRSRHARFCTRLVSDPSPSIEIVTTSPSTIWLTPAGVPVSTTSPGSSVMTCDTYDTNVAGSNTMSLVRPSWRTSSLTSQRTSTSRTSTSVTIHG